MCEQDSKNSDGGRSDFLSRHPLIGILLGCLLVSSCETSCQIADYYSAKTAILNNKSMPANNN